MQFLNCSKWFFRLKSKNRKFIKKIINLNHSKSKSYLENVIFLSTILMNHNEQKNETIEYLTMNKFKKIYFNHLIMLLKFTANQVSRIKYNKISISWCSKKQQLLPKTKTRAFKFFSNSYQLHCSSILYTLKLTTLGPSQYLHSIWLYGLNIKKFYHINKELKRVEFKMIRMIVRLV